MSNSSQGSSWIDVALPISSSASSAIGPVSVGGFTDGSFTTAATPTPGLTAGLSNVSGGVASLASSLGDLVNTTQGVLLLIAVGGACLLWMRKHA